MPKGIRKEISYNKKLIKIEFKKDKRMRIR